MTLCTSEHLTRIKLLGTGSYSKVYLVKDSQDNEFALKEHALSKSDVWAAYHDTDALMKLRNVPEVVNVKNVCYRKDSIDIIMELMDVNLWEYIHQTSLDERLKHVEKLLNTMLRILYIFRSINLVHYDIKSANILINQNYDIEFKISDFGLSYFPIKEHSPPDNEVYSIVYRPPEFRRSRRDHRGQQQTR